MIINDDKIWLIEYVNELFQDKVVGYLAMNFSTILEAESESIIKKSWRKKINVDEVIALVKKHPQEVEKQWQEDYKQLKKIVDYGGAMEYEEMMLILGLRSDLESGLLFVEKKPEEILSHVDENLRAVLELNRQYTRDCRNANRKNTGGLETYLTKHWWWRYDEEAKK